jgi:hypothetical protein
MSGGAKMPIRMNARMIEAGDRDRRPELPQQAAPAREGGPRPRPVIATPIWRGQQP